MTFKKDSTELLYYILKQMTNEHLAFNRGRGLRDSVIEIHEKDFIDRVSVKTLAYSSRLQCLFIYFQKYLLGLWAK